MDKGLTVPKWVLIVQPKTTQMLQNLSAQFVFPSPKVLDFNEKRLHWHTGLICSRSFQNHAFKGWLSLETMKLWLLVLTKTHFLMTFIIKLILGNIFTKMKNPPGGATVKK